MSDNGDRHTMAPKDWTIATLLGLAALLAGIAICGWAAWRGLHPDGSIEQVLPAAIFGAMMWATGLLFLRVHRW